MRILDLTKLLMYEFHYVYLKNKFGNKSRLLFTDTNSLIYEIETEDVYEDFSTDKEMFDVSIYSAKSKYYDDSNKLVVKMKYEIGAVAIEDFIELKKKMYSFLIDDSSSRVNMGRSETQILEQLF